MARAAWAWIRRRDPGLIAIRRAGRVTVVASFTFCFFFYGLHDQGLATYGLFAAVAMGFLAQIPGSARRRCATVVRAVPAALLLVTAGTLLARSLWAASIGVLTIGFVIALARAGSASLDSVAAGLQLFFILACFPPYEPRALGSRLLGVLVGMGLIAIAERLLWPEPDPVTYERLLASAADRLAENLAGCATLGQRTEASSYVDWPAEAAWPAGLPTGARPTSARRRDEGLRDAGRALSYALARLRELPDGASPPPDCAELLPAAATTARATAAALRANTVAALGAGTDATVGTDATAGTDTGAGTGTGAATAPVPDPLGQAIDAVRSRLPESNGSTDRDQARLRAGYLSIAEAVWGMAVAVRVALGGDVQPGPASPAVRPERFPYASLSAPRLWWRRYTVHFTPRSVYFQGAVRIALALTAARLVAGTFELAHGFWVLLATLTLLRGRAANTGLTLGPATLGTVIGAAVVGVLLVVVGPRPGVYAAIMPPVMLLALAAGALFGLAWGQALFTVVVTLVFAQLAPAGARIAEVRALDVVIGALIGVAAGVIAWPRGALAAVRRSTADLLVASAELAGATVQRLALASPDDQTPTTARLRATRELAEAAYRAYELERRRSDQSLPDWSAAITVADGVERGSAILLDTRAVGTHAPGSPVAERWADQFSTVCGAVAADVRAGRGPRPLPRAVSPPPDSTNVDIYLWLNAALREVARVDPNAR